MAATVAATTTATVAATTAAKMAAKSYAHVAATIPLMPQAIRAAYKPTEVHEITIRIGDAADREEALKQNSQAIVHKLQAAGPLDTYRI
jgi:hypothetical protein